MMEPITDRTATIWVRTGGSKFLHTREQLRGIPTPQRTDTWLPISHISLLEAVEAKLAQRRIRLRTTAAHLLFSGGARYLGLFELGSEIGGSDYHLLLGVRNSTDKSQAAALLIGRADKELRTLSFHGEILIKRKHTSNIVRDLPAIVDEAVDQLHDARDAQQRRVDLYKKELLARPRDVHDLIIRAMDKDVLAASNIPKALKQWREPEFDCLKPRTAWSFFNCVTMAIQGSLWSLPIRTRALHGLIDDHFGLTEELLKGNIQGVKVEQGEADNG